MGFDQSPAARKLSKGERGVTLADEWDGRGWGGQVSEGREEAVCLCMRARPDSYPLTQSYPSTPLYTDTHTQSYTPLTQTPTHAILPPTTHTPTAFWLACLEGSLHSNIRVYLAKIGVLWW